MSSTNELWTIGQLTEQVAAALQHDPGSGENVRVDRRVREVPDARTIRWYQTSGLVDRPVAMRGRTALYGRRHLLQLLAIKRLQGDGRALSDIQAELAGMPDATLVNLAGAPNAMPAGAPNADAPGARRGTMVGGTAETIDHTATRQIASQERFWASAPAAARTMAVPGRYGAAAEPPVDSLTGVRVDASLSVLVENLARQLGADDIAAIRRTARPLVETLRRRGLVTSPPGPFPTSPPVIEEDPT